MNDETTNAWAERAVARGRRWATGAWPGSARHRVDLLFGRQRRGGRRSTPRLGTSSWPVQPRRPVTRGGSTAAWRPSAPQRRSGSRRCVTRDHRLGRRALSGIRGILARAEIQVDPVNTLPIRSVPRLAVACLRPPGALPLPDPSREVLGGHRHHRPCAARIAEGDA
jgi:hypothetical protein